MRRTMYSILYGLLKGFLRGYFDQFLPYSDFRTEFNSCARCDFIVIAVLNLNQSHHIGSFSITFGCLLDVLGIELFKAAKTSLVPFLSLFLYHGGKKFVYIIIVKTRYIRGRKCYSFYI